VVLFQQLSMSGTADLLPCSIAASRYRNHDSSNRTVHLAAVLNSLSFKVTVLHLFLLHRDKIASSMPGVKLSEAQVAPTLDVNFFHLM
jgi:hypothetical protein